MLQKFIEKIDKQRRIRNFIHAHAFFDMPAFFMRDMIDGITTISRTKRIFRTIRQPHTQKDYKVIILGVRTNPVPGLIHFDALFGHAFQILGAQVRMLYHDGVLTSTDAQTVFRSEAPQLFVASILGRSMKKALHLPCISYRDYVSGQDIADIQRIVANVPNDKLESFTYLGVSAGMHAKASTIRYFLSGLIDLDSKIHVSIFRKKLVDAMIAAKVASGVVAQEKPNLLFLLHGIYATWGPFLEYFSKQGINTIMYGNMPSRFGHFIFYRAQKVNAIVSTRAWEAFKKLPLTKQEEEHANKYFGTRAKGKDGDQKWYEQNFDRSLQAQDLLRSLSDDNYQYRYVCYTNLAWDVYVEGHECKFFEDVFDWLNATMQFFLKHPKYQLIIKPHPGELIWDKTSQSIYGYIKEHYPNLPANIHILPANVPLTAYDLLTEKTIGLVFNGSLGLDLANLGVPVLVVADIHYKDAGVVYPVETLQEYEKLLRDPLPLFDFAKRHGKLAKKYAYFYYYKAMMRIPFYRDDTWSELDWSIMRDIKTLFASNAPLIKIAHAIIAGKDIINPL